LLLLLLCSRYEAVVFTRERNIKKWCAIATQAVDVRNACFGRWWAAVSRAGVEDLKAVDGISAEMAQKIYDFFNERRV
jgi:DNA integrity scanning protein DisA with diadenylate cyclase activity